MIGRPLDFSALQALKNSLTGIRRNHVTTLTHYVSTPKTGFWHQPTKKYKSSLSSTATCVSSLVRANLWCDGDAPLRDRTTEVAADIIVKNESAGLLPDNPFSLSFVAEAVLDLMEAQPQYPGSNDHRRIVTEEIAPKLEAHLRAGDNDKIKGKLGKPGSSSISPYPPSAYLTELTYRVVLRADKAAAEGELKDLVHAWARSEINKQLALINARSRVGDPMQLAYALILAVSTTPAEHSSPEDKEIFGHALDVFFESQNEDGSWPLSRPLFHYPEVGNAYCFEYELLTELLACHQLEEELLKYLDRLGRATELLMKTSYDLAPEKPGTVVCWASGHHPQLEGPESWSTASVYAFAYTLDRLVSEAIRRALFAEVRAVYSSPPSEPTSPPKDGSVGDFAKGFLDADIPRKDGSILSLRETLATRFVFPIAKEATLVARGGKLGDETPMSAIFFGPPGTSKTELAKTISKYLNWPLLSVDPSYLVQDGLDKIQAVANKLFTMLVYSEQIVVLLDEFDEMGRNREKNEDLLSRFITTAMLPKLAAINKARKIVFLLATNYVGGFDAAFSRGGRFDLILPVLQPSLQEKLNADSKDTPGWRQTFERALGLLTPAAKANAERKIKDLTFMETKVLVSDLSHAQDAPRVEEIVEAIWTGCTLERDNNADKSTEPVGKARAANKWRTTSEADALNHTRLPPIYDDRTPSTAVALSLTPEKRKIKTKAPKAKPSKRK